MNRYMSLLSRVHVDLGALQEYGKALRAVVPEGEDQAMAVSLRGAADGAVWETCAVFAGGMCKPRV